MNFSYCVPDQNFPDGLYWSKVLKVSANRDGDYYVAVVESLRARQVRVLHPDAEIFNVVGGVEIRLHVAFVRGHEENERKMR